MSIGPGISRMSLTQRPDASDVPHAALVKYGFLSFSHQTVRLSKSFSLMGTQVKFDPGKYGFQNLKKITDFHICQWTMITKNKICKANANI